jgi:probable addiction module antidote protein
MGIKMEYNSTPFDPANYIDTPEAAQAYLEEAFATGHVGFIADAIGVVAKAQGMTRIAQEAGLSRGSLYKALAPDANPSMDTILKVMAAAGFRLRPEAVERRQPA